MKNELQTKGGAAVGGLGAWVLACHLLWLAGCGTKPPPPPSAPAPAKPAAAKVAASTNDVVATNFFVGVFDEPGDTGFDPFFPETERIRPPAVTEPHPPGPEDGNKPPVIPPDPTLSLKAILGAPPRRVATINRTTFEEGEEALVKWAGGTVRVKCLTIRDDSVSILADGKEKELRFREK